MNDQYIKPVTAAAGKMSWALMMNPDGLDCDLLWVLLFVEGSNLECFYRCLVKLFMRFLGVPSDLEVFLIVGAFIATCFKPTPFREGVSAS